MIGFSEGKKQKSKSSHDMSDFERVTSINDSVPEDGKKKASTENSGKKRRPVQRAQQPGERSAGVRGAPDREQDKAPPTDTENAMDDYEDSHNPGNRNKAALVIVIATVIALAALAVVFVLKGNHDNNRDTLISRGFNSPQLAATRILPSKARLGLIPRSLLRGSLLADSFLDDTASDNVYDSDGNLIYDEDNNVVNPDALNPGEKEFTGNDGGTAPEQVYNVSDFLKDINGIDVSAVYNVDHIEFVYDYVNYSLRRGVVDDGLELYWLDIDYKGLKYRAQIPFYYAKDLDDKGILRMHIEVLNLEGGGKIISYMEVAQPE